MSSSRKIEVGYIYGSETQEANVRIEVHQNKLRRCKNQTASHHGFKNNVMSLVVEPQ